MSWSDVTWDWSGDPIPAPARPIRELVLGALAAQVLILRTCAGYCHDRTPRGPACPDHRDDLTLATEFEAAYMRIARIGSDGAFLELHRGADPMIVIILAGIGALWLAIAVMAVATVVVAAALARRLDGRDDIEREGVPDYVPAEWAEYMP